MKHYYESVFENCGNTCVSTAFAIREHAAIQKWQRSPKQF